MNIPVIQDLRVGENLQDHIGLGGLTFMVNQPVSVTLNRVYAVRPIIEYAIMGGTMLFPFNFKQNLKAIL